jgi:hypothetical protein
VTVYWLTFADAPRVFDLSLGLGMGVTAYDKEDAIKQAAAVTDVEIVAIREVESFDELEQNHVVPNMGFMLRRGIWFPQGYAEIA